MRCKVCRGPIKQGPHPFFWFHDNTGGAYAGQQVADHDAEPDDDSEPHEVSDEEAPTCPTCLTGYGILLGQLGLRLHYRCRHCGADFSQVEEPDLSTPAAIARLIKRDWRNVHYAARPYLEAMLTLNSINDDHWHDSGQSVVRYFLNNAKTYRGENAKVYKAALKKLAGME